MKWTARKEAAMVKHINKATYVLSDIRDHHPIISVRKNAESILDLMPWIAFSLDQHLASEADGVAE